MWSNSDYVPGIDVSHYQKKIDWQKVKDSGVVYSFIKATEGKEYFDEYFDANWSGARRAGVVRGAYHFFLPNIDPVEQAQHFLNAVGDILHTSDLPPVLDIESSPKYVYESFLPYSVEERLQRMETWLKVVEEATGRQPIIYTNLYTWKIFMGNSEEYTNYPLWIANYGADTPSVPANNWGGKSWLLWQFTYQGSVPGIYNAAAVVDQNVFKGSLQDFNEWVGIEGERKLPPNIYNHQMLEAISRSAKYFNESVDEWLIKTDLNYLLLAKNAERPYDGPAIEDLPLSDEEKTVLKNTIPEIIDEYKQSIYSRMTNQDMINACYQAAKKVEIAGWTLLVKAGLMDIVNHRDSLYIGPKIDEMEKLSAAEKNALASILGVSLKTGQSNEGTDTEGQEPEVEEPVVEEPSDEEPGEEDPVIEEPNVEEPVLGDPVVEGPVVEDPVVEEPAEEEPQEEPVEEPEPEPIEIPGNIFGFPASIKNQDVINAIYKVADMFGLSGWALLDFAGLTDLIKDREAEYTGVMINEMENLSSQQRTALADILGVVVLDAQPESDPAADIEDNDEESEGEGNPPEETDNTPQGDTPYPGVTNQNVIDAFTSTEELLDKVGWNLINIVQLQSIMDKPDQAYTGPRVEQLNGITPDQKAILLEMILEEGGIKGEETYPGLVNQDIINMFYQVAAKFSEAGWQWMAKSGLTYMISSRDMRYKPYRGPKIENLDGFTNEQKQALLSALGLSVTI